jgi:hypothetical protein
MWFCIPSHLNTVVDTVRNQDLSLVSALSERKKEKKKSVMWSETVSVF